MKILFTCKPDEPYIITLVKNLKTYAEVVVSKDAFFKPDESFDILHLQWPEHLMKITKNADVEAFLSLLQKWKTFSKIVITRHNEVPHLKKNEFYLKLYDLMYNYADAIVHLGNYSLANFRNSGSYTCKQVFIPHHLFGFYKNSSDKLSSRKRLHIPLDSKILLAFGLIRNSIERKLLDDVLNCVEYKKKYLLIPRNWSRISIRLHPFIALKRKLVILKLKFFKNIIAGDKPIKDDCVQYYFNASDIIVLPRVDNLNSGVLFLALEFGKVVIAPRSGNISEVMEKFGFPFFDENNSDSLAKAISLALELSTNKEFIESIKKKANQFYNPRNIASEHYSLYKHLIN